MITIMTKSDGFIFTVVFCAMVLDFISGTVVAVLRHEWKSKVMREGLLHKCSLLLCVVLGVVLDIGQCYLELGISIPAYKCISAYITLMEAGSVIENVCKVNPGLAPKKLRAVLGLSANEDDKEDNSNEAD